MKLCASCPVETVMELQSNASKTSDVPHHGLSSAEKNRKRKMLMVVKMLQQLRSQDDTDASVSFSPLTSILVHFNIGAKHFPKGSRIILDVIFRPSRQQPFKSTLREKTEMLESGHRCRVTRFKAMTP